LILVISMLYGYSIWRNNQDYRRTQSSQAALLTAQGVNSARNNDLDSALTLLTTAINLDQEYPEAFYARNQIYVQRKDYQNALNDIKKAIALKPDIVRYKLRLAETYLSVGDQQSMQEALKVLNELINLRDMYANIIQNEKGNSNERTPIDTDFTNQFDALRPQIYFTRGNANYALKEFGSAIADYSQAIKANPNFREAFLKRSQAYDITGAQLQAEADRQTAAEVARATNDAKPNPSPTP
jgi:tetratricopeptide (TPR) repeat protein